MTGPANYCFEIGIFLLVLLGLSLNGCSSCQQEEVTNLTSDAIALRLPPPPTPPVKIAPPPPPEPPPEVDHEEMAEETPSEEIITDLATSGAPPVPPGTYMAEDLTMRLKEKMAEAYGGDMDRVPDAKIYLSNGSLTELIDFYEERGYRVKRVTVPVVRILRPALRSRPELADRINIDDYEGVEIHQVIVEGTGISAADRYIDPDTFEIRERMFVTEMPIKK